MSRNLGIGGYTRIEHEGDFAFRRDGDHLELHHWCPKFLVCITPVRINTPAGDTPTGRYWNFDGNFECPSVSPSIGCDSAPRCGKHKTLTKGEFV